MSGRLRSDLRLYRRVIRQVGRHWTSVLGLLALSLLSTPIALLQPVPLQIAVDSVIGSKPLAPVIDRIVPDGMTRSETGLLLFAVGLSLVIALFKEIRKNGLWVANTYVGQKLVMDFRAQLLRHAQRLSFTYHDAKGTADAIYRVQHDAPAIATIAVESTIPVITAAFTFVSMLYVCARLDWQLTLIGVLVLPAFLGVSQVSRGKLRKQWNELKNHESSNLSVVQEVLGAARVVKAFGQEDREHRRYVNRSAEILRKRLRVTFTEGGFGMLRRMLMATAAGAVLFVGVRHVKSGELSMGEFLLMMSYLGSLYGPVNVLGSLTSSLQAHLASAERAFALLDEAPDVPERPNARPLLRATGAIAFQDVSFAYEADRPALRNVSFEIPAGTRLGIAGTTGAGKTTLVNLVTRFCDPTEGQVLLDGVDLRDYRLVDLRNQFALVLQDPILFSTTIAENIAYGKPDASDDEIVEAATAANAHDFIMRLPKQYQTQVGERGLRLSGGERQRLSIARAFLKRAAILLLDEPTSSIDMKTEASIMEALKRLMEGRTTIMIAHRLSTLQECDRLLVLEKGAVVSFTSDLSEATRFALWRGDEEVHAGQRRG
jgi:ATP-binding cassette, subfamily B, bacterial